MFSLLILHQGFHYDAETWCNRFCCTSETIKQFCSCCLRPPSTRPVKQLFVLPYIFSKAMARMSLFVLAMVAFIALIQILNLTQAVVINVGRAWMIGAGMSFLVMFILSQRKFQPDGVMAFCRSMGVPEVEELMFSYSWKIQEDAIRTLAKAVWSTGVGVWIDVAKLCPGDEIRPVVRTMVRSVYKCVVFISQRTCLHSVVSHLTNLLACRSRLPSPSIHQAFPRLRNFVQRTSRRRTAAWSSGRRRSTQRS